MPEQKPQGESDPRAASGEIDGKMIPIERLNQVLDKLHKVETDNAELRGKVDGLVARPAPAPEKAPDPPPEYTRAQLKTAVVAGTITEDEMDRILETQLERRLSRRNADQINQTAAVQTTVAVLSAEIGQYKQAIPELMDQSSAGFRAVATQYHKLVALGSPPTLATELAAISAVYGPPEKLQKPGRREVESHEETGSGTGEPGKVDLRTDGQPKGLTAREREFYAPKVGAGKYYPDWAAVAKEMEFSNPILRKRMGART